MFLPKQISCRPPALEKISHRFSKLAGALPRRRSRMCKLSRHGGHAAESFGRSVAAMRTLPCRANPARPLRRFAAPSPLPAAIETVRRGHSPLQQRHQQQRHDVDDLDQRVDRRARGVLVRIADGVASHGRTSNRLQPRSGLTLGRNGRLPIRRPARPCKDRKSGRRFSLRRPGVVPAAHGCGSARARLRIRWGTALSAASLWPAEAWERPAERLLRSASRSVRCDP